MVMLRKLPLFVIGLLVHTTLAPAQSAPLARKVFSSDSMSVSFPTLSPDERWLVFSTRVSNQEMRLMIQPLTGGSLRELAIPKGVHWRPRFTPAGDRLVFTSTLPRRLPTDDAYYLVSAPFDTRTGTLTGSPRQISLEGVRQATGWRIHTISPDGQSIAYVGDGSNAIKLVPITGGSSRTLVEPASLPTRIAWSPDGRFLTYEVAEGLRFVRMRVNVEGGPPRVIVRSSEQLGTLSPDNEYSFTSVVGKPNGAAALRLFASNGRLLGEVALLSRPELLYGAFVAGGKYILGASDNAVANIKIVSTEGAPVRQISAGTSYDWPYGWDADGEVVYAWTDSGISHFSRAGELKRHVRVPEDPSFRSTLGFQDGHLIYRASDAPAPANYRIMALRLTDGVRTELVRDVPSLPCCEPVGPGGMYYGITGREFYYRTLRGERVRLHAMRVGGASRVIGEIPPGTVRGSAVFQSRIVYLEPTKDSIRLQLVPGSGRLPVTLAKFGAGVYPEFAWSQDGRQLAVSAMRPPSLSIYRFDDVGNMQGSPQVHVLPFEYWFETFWLPDGSGLTMIAQPRGASVTEVAVVKLADPQHPVLLTKDDKANKWGHSLSPDGKFVTYASERLKGSSIYQIDVTELLKQVRARK
jgi:Tol biopolymer transport system component